MIRDPIGLAGPLRKRKADESPVSGHGSGAAVRPILAMVLAMLALSAAAQPQVETTVSYYDVSGATPSEIRHELNRKRPRRWDGYTAWNVSWRFRYAPSGGECQMTEVVTRVTVHYTLPRWRALSGASGETRDRWERYKRALKVHEDGHRDIGVGVAEEIDNALRGMRAANCRELGARANGAGYRLLEAARAQEREYDRTTNNGASQGARFP